MFPGLSTVIVEVAYVTHCCILAFQFTALLSTSAMSAQQPIAATANASGSTAPTRPDPSPPPAPGTFKIYRPPTALPSLPAPPPPPSDDFFTPTQADLREQQAHLNAQTSALNPSSITLRKEKEKQREKRLEKWPEVSGFGSQILYEIAGEQRLGGA